MFTKTTGILIIPTWLAAMSWLIAHDVWPHLTAMEAPPLTVNEWLKTEGKRTQYGISDDLGDMGSIWTEYIIDEVSIQRRDLIWIDRLPVGPTPIRMNIDSIFTGAGVLDEFTVKLTTSEGMMKLHGERFRAHFSFELRMGTTNKTMKVPLTDGDVISGAFNPFSQLSDLRVGQTWRIQVFNPVAVLLGVGDRFIPMLVKVTGEERIAVGDRQINCLIVESPRAKAWVDAHGAVQVQEAELPLVGRLRMTRKPTFDEEGRDHAKKHWFYAKGRHFVD